MTKSELISTAEKKIKQQDFEGALRLLEPKVPLYENDAHFFYILGVACYYKNDLAGAEIYFTRSLAIDHDNLNPQLFLAIIALKRRDTATAIVCWLDILEFNPDHKAAKYGLDELKKITTNADLSRFILSEKIAKLLPAQRFTSSVAVKRMMKIAITAGSLLLVVFLVQFVKTADPLKRFYKPTRLSTLAAQTLDDLETVENEEETPAANWPSDLDITQEEAEKLYDQATRAFNNHNDNLVQQLINQIKRSKASIALKNQALVLEPALAVPDFTNPPKTKIEIKAVLEKPWLYEKCYVVWQGALKDVAISNASERVEFSLLVGYDKKTIVEGEIAVEAYFNIFLEPSLITQVLGQVLLDEENEPYLKALSIYQLIN